MPVWTNRQADRANRMAGGLNLSKGLTDLRWHMSPSFIVTRWPRTDC
jgi:hypothetical protein